MANRHNRRVMLAAARKGASKKSAKKPAEKKNLPDVLSNASRALPPGLEVARRVTFSLRKWAPDAEPIVVTFCSAFKKKKPITGAGANAIDPETGEPMAKKQPPIVAEIIEWKNVGTDTRPQWSSTGEVMELIIPAVLRGVLMEEYGPAKEDGEPLFVGRTFFITTTPKAINKNYRTFGLSEIRTPEMPKKAAE